MIPAQDSDDHNIDFLFRRALLGALGKASRLVGAIATEVRPREEAAPVALPEAGKLAGTRRGAHEWSCSIPSGVFNSARLI